MDQKLVLEKWLKQIRNGEINPSALGLGNDRGKAIEKLESELKKMSSSRSIPRKQTFLQRETFIKPTYFTGLLVLQAQMISMSDIDVIKKDLENIYNKIPDFECKHCHSCCGPIIWFKTEEILMEKYMEEHEIENVKWTTKEFQENKMKCPFLKNDRCEIYQARPIVCRLQGNVPDLPCKCIKNGFMSEELIDDIKKDFYELNRKFQGDNVFYSTRKMTKI